MMNQRQNKRRSVNHETEVCVAMIDIYGKGHLQPGSGNQPGKPNDVLVPGEMYIECKETSKASISFKHAWIETLRKLSWQGALRSVVSLKFTNESSTIYYVVDDDTFHHLLKCERDLRAIVDTVGPQATERATLQ